MKIKDFKEWNKITENTELLDKTEEYWAKKCELRESIGYYRGYMDAMNVYGLYNKNNKDASSTKDYIEKEKAHDNDQNELNKLKQ